MYVTLGSKCQLYVVEWVCCHCCSCCEQ